MDTFRLDTTEFSRELAVLLQLLREGTEALGRGTGLDAEELRGLNGELLVQLARHHRVYPQLYSKLHAHGKNVLPASVMKILQRDYQANTFEMLRLGAEMNSLCRQLEEKDIRTIVLKGPVLAADLYGDLSQRTCGDLDILVPLDNLEQVEALLSRLGYEKDEYIETILNDWKWRHHHVTFLHHTKGFKVEVHWRLGPGPGAEPAFEDLWANRRISKASGYPVYYLGREDLFLFLVTHGARHGWSRLRWLTDIDRLSVQSLDEDRLLSLLRQYKQTHIAGQALVLASALLGTPLSPGLAKLAGAKRARRHAEGALYYVSRMINLHSEPLPEDVSRYHKRHLFTLMSPYHKALFVMSFLYPYPEDAETLLLPKPLHFLYFPLRPFLWMWRKTKKLALS